MHFTYLLSKRCPTAEKIRDRHNGSITERDSNGLWDQRKKKNVLHYNTVGLVSNDTLWSY